MSPAVMSISNKGINILKYVCSYAICMLIYFPIPIMFKRVTTHYQTLQTWIGHNPTCYYNFDALPHALPFIFSQFNMGRS